MLDQVGLLDSSILSKRIVPIASIDLTIGRVNIMHLKLTDHIMRLTDG